MNQNIEYIIIGTAAGWAGFYLIRRVYKAFRIKDDGCEGACGCASADLKKNKKLS
jgi:hypothetical protein